MQKAFELLRDVANPDITSDQLLTRREHMLSTSSDAFTRYITGWLAIESARKTEGLATDELDLARTDWQSVIDEPQTHYSDHSLVLPYMARTCFQLASVIQNPSQNFSLDQRQYICKRLGSISRSDNTYLQTSESIRTLGYLTELTTLQLIWRGGFEDSIIAVPTNPAQDAGINTKTNADLHAYGNFSETPITPVPIQVKLKKQGQYQNYNNFRVLLIGADDNFFTESKLPLKEKVVWITEACAKEANGSLEDNNALKMLDRSSTRIKYKIRKHSRRHNKRLNKYVQPTETTETQE